jgi:uncharacterized protein
LHLNLILPLVMLGAILALLFAPVQKALQGFLGRRRHLVFAAPVALTVVFAAAAWKAHAEVVPLTLAIAGYTLAPALLKYFWPKSAVTDLAAMLALWLPLEFAGGAARWVPRASQGSLHTVAYGVAILLALWLFLLFRRMPGMKYQWPCALRDLTLPALGYLIVAPVLIALGLYFSFMGPFRIPARLSVWLVVSRYAVILAATALPEEILFRGLVQNWIQQRLGVNWASLAVAAVVFGAAHLNNLGTAAPNWRYMVLATIAGVAFGRVFQKSGSILSSAMLHAAVNTTRHLLFG